MVAEFEVEGVEPGKVEVAPGVYDIDWTDGLDGVFTDGPFDELLEEGAA